MQVTADEDVHFNVRGSNEVERVVYVPPLAQAEDGSRLDPHAQRLARRRDDGLETGPRGRVFINANQYFEGITPVVWRFRVGGYQVCERWLKDRQGGTLTHDDIEHYQGIVSALAETRMLMAQIDSLIADHGGWPLR